MSHRLALALLALGATGCSCTSKPPAAVPEAVIEHNILGTAYLGQQNWADAEAAFRRGLELRPADPLLLTNVGIALIQQSEIEPAKGTLLEALSSDPDYPYAHYNLGLLENQDGAFAEAARHFEAVARVDPEELFTQYYLGTTLSRIGREDEAVRAFRKALERNPTHVSSLYGLGRLLMQRGEGDEGRRMIELSQEVRARSGLDEAVGSQYGEQGPYAMGIDYPGDALAAPEPLELHFETWGAAEGVESTAGVFVAAPATAAAAPRLVLAQGSRLVGLDAKGTAALASEAPSASEIRALSAGDIDDDGTVELVALVGGPALSAMVAEPSSDGTYAWNESAFGGTAPIEGTDGVAITLLDRDHDGDLDALWCWNGTAPACSIATNDGSGRFETRSSSEHGFTYAGHASGPVRVAFSDADNDRDVDLIVGGPAGVWLYANQRDGTFEDISAHVGLGAQLAGQDFAIVDLDKNGWMDLLLAGTQGVQFAANHAGRFEAPVAIATGAARVDRGSPVVLDYDNDGFLDLALGGEGSVSFVRNLGQGRWKAEGSLASPLPTPAVVEPRTAFDADGDGDLDVAAEADGRFFLLRNDGGSAHRWISLASHGVGDNSLGVGAKVEVLSGALRQKFEVTGPLPVHAGLGTREVVQSVRYLWPSGVLQDEIELATNTTKQIEQLDRKGTSCPLLYAWRDGTWQFVTDFLGGSAIGYQLAPGVFNVPDTDEYVKLEEGLDTDAAGQVRVRLNNQLEEVIWFDRVELLAVDHPRGTELYPNESLMPGPPWPDFELYASADVRPIRSARGVESGRDLTRTLAARDRDFADDFARLAPKGYAAMHTLELDLGELPRGRLVLLLEGWIDYADSSANVAAAQAGLRAEPPSLALADGRGGWFDPGLRIGFPAGLPKAMTIDLTGLFPSAEHRLRIRTNLRIYWDRVRVMVGGETVPVHVTRLEPRLATLGYGGFPRPTSPDGRAPFAYDPARVDAFSPWKAHTGVYTAFGEVTELLGKLDDRFVTTRNGDEVLLSFDAPAPSEPGWQRSWLLYADGFGKDMDLNSAASDRVQPVPYHDMPHYPYGAEASPPLTARVPPGGRVVLPSDRGWHGAVPQAVAKRTR